MEGMKYIKESVIEKFIKAANTLHKYDNSIDIDYTKYISQYNSASKTLLPIIAKLNLKTYIFLCEEFPNFDFDFEGRLKAEFSFYEKIIDKALSKSAYEGYDIFAFRIILNSVSYDINTAFCTHNDKKDIYEYKFKCKDKKEALAINVGDTITLQDGESIIVTPDNLTFMNNRVYVISENGSYLSLSGSKITKRDRSTLNPLLYDIEDKLSVFYKENGYEHLSNRDKDYVKFSKKLKYPIKDSKGKAITNLKNIMNSENSLAVITRLKQLLEQHNSKISDINNVKLSNGKFLPCYQSLQQTYYYEPYDIYFEDQIRTIHMHNIAENDAHFAHDTYKTNRLDKNSFSKLPTFITFSKKIIDGEPQYSYKIHDIEYSIEKTFKMSLEDFITDIKKKEEEENKALNKTPDDDTKGPEI